MNLRFSPGADLRGSNGLRAAPGSDILISFGRSCGREVIHFFCEASEAHMMLVLQRMFLLKKERKWLVVRNASAFFSCLICSH